MGIEDIRIEIDNEKKEDINNLVVAKALTLKEAEALLTLTNNPAVKKWVSIFVNEPLIVLESQHDKETRTNENFILKGQVFRLKKQRDWEQGLKNKVDTLNDQLYKLQLEKEGI